MTAVWEDPTGANYETDYAYDTLDDLTSVTQKGGAASTSWRNRGFTYDSLSRLKCAANPEVTSSQNNPASCPGTDTGSYTPGTIGYTYDGVGNLATRTAPAPNQTGSATITTSYQYDPVNRLTQKSYSDGSPSATFQYDTSTEAGASNDIGRRTYASVVTGTTLLYQRSQPAYDPMGRLALEYECAPDSCTQNRYSVAYGYDLAGNESSVTAGFPGAGSQTQTNTYNAAGHLTTVNTTLAAFPILANVTYAPQGTPQSASIGPSMVQNWGYNNRGWVTSITAAPTSQASFYSLGLGYFSNGNVASANDSVNGNWAYTYDPLNRLSTAVASNVGEGCTFAYDAWGNRTTEAPYTGTCNNTSFAFTTRNQVVGYTYDAAGNQLGDGVHTYTYDAENRIQTVDGGTTYVYDADGRRVGKKTASGFTAEYIFDQDGRELAQLGVGGSLVRGEVYTAGRHVATYNGQGLYFTFEDHLGAERIRRNADSSPLETCTNLPFGEAQQCSGPDVSALHFTGKERDAESGLDYFDARHYSSSMGRFMQPDPLAGHVSDPQTLNRCAYVRNNPTNLTDPTGLDFNLSCEKEGDTCHNGRQGTYSSADANGNRTFTATVISNDQNGNLVDQSGNQYSASVSGAGVSFTQAGSNQSSLGTFINGSNETNLTATNLPGFSFTFTYSNPAGNITSGGVFSFSGNAQQAERALEAAGFHHYSADEYDILHPSSLTYHAVDFRSAGDPGTGAHAGHFTVKDPWLFANPFSALGPATGDLHLGEHNNNTPGGFWPHTQEVINTFRDKLGLY